MRSGLDQLQTVANAVANASPDFDDQQQRIALWVYRTLGKGAPATPSEIAHLAGTSVNDVEALLTSIPGVFFNQDGNVVGFWGLDTRRLSPTHRLQLDEHEIFAWCAWDTLFLPGLLDATLSVESACAATGEEITLTVSPTGVVDTSHPGGVVSFLFPEGDFDAGLVQSFCHFVYFFANGEVGETWTAEHPGTFLMTLDEAFELARITNMLRFPSLVRAR